ncbi:Ubiquitin-like-specific protease ESD4 [Striga hermonthica]|uniref:Ubiquitin-like-specific protease ESD4 n=1 Tax=Striga hermonthica TaxID=68872 RepID=A0A9N7NSX9_STRHE|nr:Ubiquitin-like-specific protease ESD4 [Striga hermonthica]
MPFTYGGSEQQQSKPRFSCRAIRSHISFLDPKPRVRREIHAPVRLRSLGFFSGTGRVEGVAFPAKMGNCFGALFSCSNLSNGAVKCFGLFEKDEEKVGFENADRENLVDGSDDSSVEEVEVVDISRSEWVIGYGAVSFKEEQKFKMVVKDSRFTEFSLIEDVNASVLPAHKKLYDSTKSSDDRPSQLDLDMEYNEKCLQGLRLSRPQKKDRHVRKDRVGECFVPITDEEEELVASALSNFNWEKVVVSHDNSNIDISGEKLQCLRLQKWLNDEVINLYLYLLKEREEREPQKFLKCHFFNTFFYKKLISGIDGYNFQAVRRWTTQKKLGYHLLDCEKIFVPIHQVAHWCLAIINNKDKKFEYLDSLKGFDSQVMSALSRYYVDEVKDKIGKDIDVSSWEQVFVTNLPEQENGFDCGMFMIKYMDFYSRDIGLCFNQSDMPYFRRRTAKEILKLRAE